MRGHVLRRLLSGRTRNACASIRRNALRNSGHFRGSRVDTTSVLSNTGSAPEPAERGRVRFWAHPFGSADQARV